MLREIRFLLGILLCGCAIALAAGPATGEDFDDDSDLSRTERRSRELFIDDDVLDPSFPELIAPAEEALRAEGNSDNVSEEPLDPDPIEEEIRQKVLAGEVLDETEKAMARDHFDEDTSPFEPAPESLDEELRDPVEW